MTDDELVELLIRLVNAVEDLRDSVGTISDAINLEYFEAANDEV